MRQVDVDVLLELAKDCSDNLSPEEWPQDILQEVCEEALPDGTQVFVSCDRYYALDLSSEGCSGDMFQVHDVVGRHALSGYSNGLQLLKYVSEAEIGFATEFTELTLVVHDLNETAHFIPFCSILGIAIDEVDPYEVLDYEDVLENIDLCLFNKPVDLHALVQMFHAFSFDDMRTSLYLKYLNSKLNLSEIWSACLAGEIWRVDDHVFRETLNEVKIIELLDSESFSLFATYAEDGSVSCQLCVNGRDGVEDVKVPLDSIIGLLD